MLLDRDEFLVTYDAAKADTKLLLRVVKASDGIQKLDADPNRLTLVLGEDGRIVLAVWD